MTTGINCCYRIPLPVQPLLHFPERLPRRDLFAHPRGSTAGPGDTPGSWSVSLCWAGQVPHEEPPHPGAPQLISPALLEDFYFPNVGTGCSCSSSSLFPPSLQESLLLRHPEQPLRRHPGPVGGAAPARRGPGLAGLCPGGDRKDTLQSLRGGRARARGARVPLQQERALVPLYPQDARPARL